MYTYKYEGTDQVCCFECWIIVSGKLPSNDVHEYICRVLVWGNSKPQGVMEEVGGDFRRPKVHCASSITKEKHLSEGSGDQS